MTIKGLKIEVRRGKPKTKILEEHFGGKWKYMGFGGGWRCEEKKLRVDMRYSFCDEEMYSGSIFPPEYYFYDENYNSKRIMFFDDKIIVF